MNRSVQKQKVFKENCGEDENFIGILTLSISYMVIALLKPILIGTTDVATSLLILLLWWLIIAVSISSLYYNEKNKKIEVIV